MKIKYFLIVIISVVLISSLSAQDNDTKKSSKKGLIKGFVFDNDSGLPLEAATVRLLFDVDTSLVGGTQTDKTGAFAVEAPYGKFRLVVDFIGYKTFVKRKIAVTPKKLEINLDFGQKKTHTKFDYCMSVSTGADLCFEGKKLIGSAQLRKEGYILQHGSILFDYDKDLIERIFGEKIAENSLTCLKEINPSITYEEVKNIFSTLAPCGRG